jgi:hypothetical protein
MLESCHTFYLKEKGGNWHFKTGKDFVTIQA